MKIELEVAEQTKEQIDARAEFWREQFTKPEFGRHVSTLRALYLGKEEDGYAVLAALGATLLCFARGIAGPDAVLTLVASLIAATENNVECPACYPPNNAKEPNAGH